MSFLKTTTRRTVAVASAAVLLVAGAGTASAHVTASPKEVPANSYQVLTFQVPHGCQGTADTTSLNITIPDNVYRVIPTENPNWTISTETAPVNPPVKGHHGDITSRTSHVIYTAKTPLNTHHRDAFELLIRTPDAPGATLYFPTLQNCTDGLSTNWSVIPAPGADPHSVKNPAPGVMLTDADAHGHDHDGTTPGEGEGEHHHGGDTMGSSEDSGIISGVALLASLGALALAGYNAFMAQQPHPAH